MIYETKFSNASKIGADAEISAAYTKYVRIFYPDINSLDKSRMTDTCSNRTDNINTKSMC